MPENFVATTTIETMDNLYYNYNQLSGLTQVGVPDVKQNTIKLGTYMNKTAEKTSDFKITIDKLLIFKDGKICDTFNVNKNYGLGEIELAFDGTKCGFSLPETHAYTFAVIAETSQNAIFKSEGSNRSIQKGYLEAYYFRSTTTPPFNR